MKIAPAQVNSFLAQFKNHEIQAYLFYGPNSGLSGLLAERLIKDLQTISPATVINADGNELELDASSLLSEIHNNSLFDPQKIIKIRGMRNKILSMLQQCIPVPEGVKLVMIAEELDTKSTLRAFGEKSDHIAVIASYQEDSRSSMSFVQDFLSRAKTTFDVEVPNIMAMNFTGDRMTLQNELTKLLLYIGNRNHITKQDAMLVVSNLEESGVDSLIDSLMAKNLPSAFSAMAKLSLSQISNIAIIRSLLSHCFQLHRMLLALQKGSTVADVIQKERIFFKRTSAYQQQLRIWTIEKINQIFPPLLKAEVESKSNSDQLDWQQSVILRLINAVASIA